MSRDFRVVDCRSGVIDPSEILVSADTAEQAARLAMGEDLVRGGRHPAALRARVYSKGAGPVTMVRLYSRAAQQVRPFADTKVMNRWGD